MTRVSALGEYLRFRSALPPRLSELAILITAAHWRQAYEWEIHAPAALKAGIPQSVLDAVWAGERPPDLADDQQALYDLCVALHRERTALRPGRDTGARRSWASRPPSTPSPFAAITRCWPWCSTRNRK